MRFFMDNADYYKLGFRTTAERAEEIAPTGPTFEKDLERLINKYSQENGSDTPDFILAKYLNDCLTAWNHAVSWREKWYGREPKPVGGIVDPAPSIGTSE